MFKYGLAYTIMIGVYTMKKIYVVVLGLLILFMFTSCDSKGDNQNMKYEEGIFYDKNWSDTAGTYTGNAVESKETAVAVATAVYNGMRKSQSMSNLTPQSVFFDSQDEIWIVTFGMDGKENVAGGDCSIAIQKQDGRILRIWFGE